jgi:predicted GNAT family acetyltransferase
VDFRGTFTPPELRGRGLAAEVVGAALAWAREGGKRVIPTCWYVRRHLEREGK